MKRLSHLFLLLILSLAAPLRAGAPVVIVNPSSGVDRLTRDEVTNIFMGRQKRLAGNVVAVPVEQAQPTTLRIAFYRLLVNKELPEISAYWARLFFSGQAQPPRQVASVSEVLEFVSQNRGAVGVVDGAKVDGRVRVVLDLGK
ncbi:MAG: hypothetical protein LWX11_08780 [Firmicutes bacterium]|nr:hypothetical protein [Bacillota bacterium]